MKLKRYQLVTLYNMFDSLRVGTLEEAENLYKVLEILHPIAKEVQNGDKEITKKYSYGKDKIPKDKKEEHEKERQDYAQVEIDVDIDEHKDFMKERWEKAVMHASQGQGVFGKDRIENFISINKLLQ